MRADKNSIECSVIAGVEAEPYVGDKADKIRTENLRAEQIGDDHESPRWFAAESLSCLCLGSWRPPGMRPMM